jgi:hypothetical protein
MKAPKGPKVFGQEKTEEDIRARIEWEMWAASKARENGSDAIAQGHDLAATAYSEILNKHLGKHVQTIYVLTHEDICSHLEKLRGHILFEKKFTLSSEADQYHLLMLGAIETAQRYAKLVVLKEAEEKVEIFGKRYKRYK